MKILHYVQSAVRNPPRCDDFEATFEVVRNDIRRCCEGFGPVYPAKSPYLFLLESPLTVDAYVYMEVLQPKFLSSQWLERVAEELASHDNWGVAIDNMVQAYVLIFSNRIMVTGNALKHVRTVDELGKMLVQHSYR